MRRLNQRRFDNTVRTTAVSGAKDLVPDRAQELWQTMAGAYCEQAAESARRMRKAFDKVKAALHSEG